MMPPRQAVLKMHRETPDLDSSTDAYAARFAGKVGAYFLDTQRHAVDQFIPHIPHGRILDVGGGHAQLAPHLRKIGWNVTVQGSATTAGLLLQRSTPTKIPFIVGDLLELPFQSQTFDFVLAFRMLPHLNQWQRFLAELARVCRHRIILDYPELQSVNRLGDVLFALKNSIESNTRRYRCFRQCEIVAELRSLGFHPIETYKQFAFPMALHRFMKCLPVSKALERFARSSGLTGWCGSPAVCCFERLTLSPEKGNR